MNAVSRLTLARSWRLDVIDRFVAGALVVAVIATEAPRRPGVIPVLAAVVACASVAWRRPAPKLACLAVVAGVGVFEQTGGGGDFTLGAVAIALDYYLLGQWSGRNGWDLATILLLVAPFPLILAGPNATSVADVIAPWAFFGAIPFLAGRAIASHGAMASELAEATAQLEIEQVERARRAADEERARVARELHDIVAHSVSVMVIQAVAARSVAQRDRERARAALQSVESCGREALGELRRTMGVLRRDQAEPEDLGAPGLAQLDLLADRARASGLSVDLRTEGVPYALAPEVDLAAFRIVQEALTNAIKHAGPVPVQVRVRYAERSLELDVVDGGAPHGYRPRAPGAGRGLAGMQERVSRYGGEFRSERRQGGGFQLLVRLPTTAEWSA